jgi:hypothetical protein
VITAFTHLFLRYPEGLKRFLKKSRNL